MRIGEEAILSLPSGYRGEVARDSGQYYTVADDGGLKSGLTYGELRDRIRAQGYSTDTFTTNLSMYSYTKEEHDRAQGHYCLDLSDGHTVWKLDVTDDVVAGEHGENLDIVMSYINEFVFERGWCQIEIDAWSIVITITDVESYLPKHVLGILYALRDSAFKKEGNHVG